jgi:hypothetical protein
MAIREADPCEPVVRATYIQVISHSPNPARLGCGIQLALPAVTRAGVQGNAAGKRTVVQAFALLFASMRNLVQAREHYSADEQSFSESHFRWCLRQAAPMMRVAFGGRIPDEVP